MDLSEWVRSLSRRHYSLSDLFDFEALFEGDVCADANAAYYAVQEAADKMDADAIEMDRAATAVANFVCERLPLKEGGDRFKICVDWWIQTETALLIAEGDNRGADSSAKFTASRAQLYIGPVTLEYRLKLNHTRIVISKDSDVEPPWTAIWPDIRIPVAPVRHLPKDVQVWRDQTTGMLLVDFRIYNGLCTITGRAACPSIDGVLQMTELTNSLDVQWKKDNYPSMLVNLLQDGVWMPQAYDPEHPGALGATFLVRMQQKSQRFREAYSLPPGCPLH